MRGCRRIYRLPLGLVSVGGDGVGEALWVGFYLFLFVGAIFKSILKVKLLLISRGSGDGGSDRDR